MIRTVYALETIGTGPSVFLAGPTPRSADVPSWRPEAIRLLDDLWTRPEVLTVLAPEPRDGKWTAEYDHQVSWETIAREAATVVLYWVPRDLTTMPAFTTNVEFGLDVGTGKSVILGCPPDCPNPERNRYLIWVAERHGVPVVKTLLDAAWFATERATGARRG